jgi:23S rRNA (adenine-N6)-dimethyltransferase
VSERRSGRDGRRRTLGQNFLVDGPLVERLVAGLDLGPDDLVVDIGAGVGALTIPLARTGARVWAVEPDPDWAERLTAIVDRQALTDRVRVIPTTFERLRLPRTPYRVVANPPFGRTTTILSKLLDDPTAGPIRADLVLERAVARKHAAEPPRALRTAAWSPWWEFELGMAVPRTAFRPRPSVDAAVLRIRRRAVPLLPERLARDFCEALRPLWTRSMPPIAHSDPTDPTTTMRSTR